MSTKMLDATIKSVADNGVWEAVASTPTLDRVPEIVAAGALSVVGPHRARPR